MCAILPKLELIKITLEGVESKGWRVWNAWMGNKVLDSKCETSESSGVLREGWNEEPSPALRIRVLISVMLWEARVESRDFAAEAVEERVSVKGTMIKRLPEAAGRARRSSVEVEEERTVATTTVFGRWRRALVRPRPMPVYIERVSEHVIP